MTYKDAEKKLLEAVKNCEIVSGRETEELYLFSIKYKGDNELPPGNMYSVNKETGELKAFSPMRNFELIADAKIIYIKKEDE